MIIKNTKLVELNTKIASSVLCKRYRNIKDDLIKYKCLCCNKNHQEMFIEFFKKRSANTNKLSNHHINKFVLLLQKGVYPYEYMDGWEKFNETSLPEKEDLLTQIMHT